MEPWVQALITVVCSVIASSGFWALIQSLRERNDAKTKMIKGLGHDRIMTLGMEYITRGYITKDEFENLHDYLYKPYRAMGGNGSAERIMEEVKHLPIRSDVSLER